MMNKCIWFVLVLMIKVSCFGNFYQVRSSDVSCTLVELDYGKIEVVEKVDGNKFILVYLDSSLIAPMNQGFKDGEIHVLQWRLKRFSQEVDFSESKQERQVFNNRIDSLKNSSDTSFVYGSVELSAFVNAITSDIYGMLKTKISGTLLLSFNNFNKDEKNRFLSYVNRQVLLLPKINKMMYSSYTISAELLEISSYYSMEIRSLKKILRKEKNGFVSSRILWTLFFRTGNSEYLDKYNQIIVEKSLFT